MLTVSALCSVFMKSLMTICTIAALSVLNLKSVHSHLICIFRFPFNLKVWNCRCPNEWIHKGIKKMKKKNLSVFNLFVVYWLWLCLLLLCLFLCKIYVQCPCRCTCPPLICFCLRCTALLKFEICLSIFSRFVRLLVFHRFPIDWLPCPSLSVSVRVS